ncbi:MAG: AAA family ATPase [Candidatus Aenigmarchaeota archaeon]|nr:AAA family ATPase [Candidatus Aenigmarchaeota archaeon]
MPKKLIVIVGLPGSGKSTAAEFIKREFNADIVHSGDIIREEVKRRGLEYTPENDALIADWFNKTKKRERQLVQRVWDKIKYSEKDLVVVEGFRATENIKILEEIAKIKPIVIAIIASFNVRVQRELKRGRFGKKQSINYLKLREKQEKSHGIEKLIKAADYTIDNSKLGIKQTNAEISKILHKFCCH